MKRRRIIVGVTLSIVSAGFLLVHYREPSRSVAPSYQGRSLTEWLDEISSGSPGEQARGEQAVLAIGTNAVPFLLWELQVKHSPVRKRFMAWVIRQRFLMPFRIRFKLWQNPTEEQHHDRAVRGFQVLGSQAKAAFPTLAQLVKGDATALNATRILAGYDGVGTLYFGPDVVAPLLIALTNDNSEVRRLAANGLSLAQTNASVVVPALLRTLHDPDPGVRAMAAISLGGRIYRSEAAAIIPALINSLDDSNALVRARAATRLGLFGSAARAALPALSRVLDDADIEVATSAARAIERIDPEAAPMSQEDPK